MDAIVKLGLANGGRFRITGGYRVRNLTVRSAHPLVLTLFKNGVETALKADNQRQSDPDVEVVCAVGDVLEFRTTPPADEGASCEMDLLQ
ncbi:MAG: hypothetical protein ACRD3I_05650 [Terriglobales bacterium]